METETFIHAVYTRHLLYSWPYIDRIGATISSEAIRMPSSAMRPVSSSAHVGSPLVFPWPNTWNKTCKKKTGHLRFDANHFLFDTVSYSNTLASQTSPMQTFPKKCTECCRMFWAQPEANCLLTFKYGGSISIELLWNGDFNQRTWGSYTMYKQQHVAPWGKEWCCPWQ